MREKNTQWAFLLHLSQLQLQLLHTPLFLLICHALFNLGCFFLYFSLRLLSARVAPKLQLLNCNKLRAFHLTSASHESRFQTDQRLRLKLSSTSRAADESTARHLLRLVCWVVIVATPAADVAVSERADERERRHSARAWAAKQLLVAVVVVVTEIFAKFCSAKWGVGLVAEKCNGTGSENC